MFITLGDSIGVSNIRFRQMSKIGVIQTYWTSLDSKLPYRTQQG